MTAGEVLRSRLRARVAWGWVVRPAVPGDPAGVRIRAGRQEECYWLAAVPDRPRAWTLSKERPGGAAAETYTVALGSMPQCDCPGWPRVKSCKHLVCVAEATRELEGLEMAAAATAVATVEHPKAEAAPVAVAEKMAPPGVLEQVLAMGNLAALTSEERCQVIYKLCESLKLNPLTQPFEFLNLKGKLVLYAKKGCAEQLRRRDGVSTEILKCDLVGDCAIVHVRATAPHGKGKRHADDIAAVSLTDAKGQPLVGDEKANAVMRAVTKANRRVTLSICGLGMLDETEVSAAVDYAPPQQLPPPPPAPAALPASREVTPAAPLPSTPPANTPPTASAPPTPPPSNPKPAEDKPLTGPNAALIKQIDEMAFRAKVAGQPLHTKIKTLFGADRLDQLDGTQLGQIHLELERYLHRLQSQPAAR